MADVVVPPWHRNWWEILPQPYNANPEVFVVMAPVSWSLTIAQTKDDKYQFGVLISPQRTVRGLQVIDPDVDTYLDHTEIFREYEVTPADVAWVGRIADVPDRLLNNLDLDPLCFQTRNTWRNYLSLRRCWTQAELKC